MHPEPDDRSAPQEVTLLLRCLGSERDADRLIELVYGELRSLAAAQMAAEPAGHTLQPTALVHEAWLRLVSDPDRSFESRVHFFRAAALAMRRILVDRARSVAAVKRGGGARRETLVLERGGVDPSAQQALDVIAVDEALTELESFDPRMAELVSLRWFSGLDVEETATAMELSTRTVKREWSVAKAWLATRLADEGPTAALS